MNASPPNRTPQRLRWLAGIPLLLCFLFFNSTTLHAQITHPLGDGSGGLVSASETVTCNAPVTMFYDSGGEGCDLDDPPPAVGSYDNNANTVSVLCPDVAGTPITIEFLEADIETRSTPACWDFLTIHDGNSTAAPVLFNGCGEEGFDACVGGFSGDGSDGGNIEGGPNDLNASASGVPANANNIWTSSDATGCLTVAFTSDGSVTQGGWIATLGCGVIPPPLAPPANDLCAGAIPITCGSVTSGTTAATPTEGAATNTDAPGVCGTTLNTAGGVWYSFTPTVTEDIILETCGSGFDTKLGVFEGACGALSCIEGNNDNLCGGVGSTQSTVTFTATMGTTYSIYVTGNGTSAGTFDLTLTCLPPAFCNVAQPSGGFLNDPACEAAVIAAMPSCATLWDATCASLAETLVPDCCGCLDSPTPACLNCIATLDNATITKTIPTGGSAMGFFYSDVAAGVIPTPTGTCDNFLMIYDSLGNFVVALDNGDVANFMVTCPVNPNGTTFFVTADDDGVQGGNESTQVELTVIALDGTPPTFNTAEVADITLSCDQDYTDLIVTGDVTSEMDECDSGVMDGGPREATFVDDITGLSGCFNGGTGSGTVVREWNLEDASGNLFKYEQTITIIDPTPPTFTVPADALVDYCAGDATPLPAVSGDVTDEADNCQMTGLDATYSDGPMMAGSCPNNMTFVRTWTLTDDCGNANNQMQLITLQDVTAPTSTLANVAANSSDGGTGDCFGAVTLVMDATNTSDNCSAFAGLTITNDFNAGGADASDDYPVGTTTVIFTVTDECMNSATHSVDVVVTDDEIATFTGCPANMVFPNTAGTCFNNVSWTPPTFADNCSGVSPLTVTSQATDPKGTNTINILTGGGGMDFATFPVGVSTVEYMVTDAGGMTSTCSFTVTIEDIEAPVVTCPPSDLLHFSSCNTNAMVPDYRGILNINDNCSTGYSVVQTPAPGTLLSAVATPVDGEMITVSFVVTDNAPISLSSTCSFVVTLDEDSDPIPTVAGGVLPSITGFCGPLTIEAPTAADACFGLLCGEPFPAGIATQVGPSCGGSTGPCTPISRTVNYSPGKAIPDNNALGDTSLINIPAGTPPIIEEVSVSLTMTHTWVGDLKATLTSPSGTVVELFDRPGTPPGAFGCAGNDLDVTFDDAAAMTAADFEATCNNLPAISGTFQPVVPLGMFAGESPVGEWVLTVSDNAGGDVGTIDSWTLNLCTNATSNVISQYEFPIGTHNITWVYDDGFGNVSQQLQTITVSSDVVPPTFNCQDGEVTLDGTGTGTISVADLLESASVTLVSGDNQSGTLGNTLFEITIPTATTISFDWAFDDGGDPFFEVFGFFVNGAGTGLANQTATGTQSITLAAGDVFSFVVQTADNTFGASNVTISNFSPGFSGDFSIVNWTDILQNSDGSVSVAAGEAMDNCDAEPDLTYNVSPASFTCADVGMQTVTVTVTDQAGNTGTCSAIVNVIDDTDPILVDVPANTTVDCDDIPSASGVVSATDICGIAGINFNESDNQVGNPAMCGDYNYTITREWTATDGSGNTSVGTQIITVQDVDAPTFLATLPDTIFAPADLLNCSATVNLFVTSTDFTDNCAPNNLSLTNDAPVGNGGNDASGVYPIGNTTVEFEAIDPCGNVGTYTVVVNVTDGVAPVALCSSTTISIPSGSNSVTILPLYVNNGSVDNCAGLLNPNDPTQMWVTPTSFDCSQLGNQTVTLTVSDGTLTGSCATTVTVQDLTPPDAVCAAPFSITVDANGMASVTVADIDAGSSDACSGLASTSIDMMNFDLTNLGGNTVTLTATDVSGNTATCSTLVTVEGPTTCFDVGSDVGGAGNVIEIPVTVTDFTSVNSFQFSLNITGDDTMIDLGEFEEILTNVHPSLDTPGSILFPSIQYDSLPTNDTLVQVQYGDILDGNGDPYDGVLDTVDVEAVLDTLLFANTLSISYLGDASLPGVTLNDGDVVFTLNVLLTGNIGQSTTILNIPNINNTPPEILYDFGMGNLIAGTPCFIPGGFLINELIVSGAIYTEPAANCNAPAPPVPASSPVGLVDVELYEIFMPPTPASLEDTYTTGNDGLYQFTINGSGDFEIRPEKDINWGNQLGTITSFDVQRIQAHAVGATPLCTAYKKIAADVNDSGQITTIDAALLNFFVINNVPPLPTPADPPNKSWRFVDAKQVLVNTFDANVPVFSEVIELDNLISDTTDNDFIGVKIGDIDNNIDPLQFTTGGGDDQLNKIVEGRNGSMEFVIADATTKANEPLTIDFTAKSFDDMVAYQWILKFDEKALAFDGMTAKALQNLSDNNVGIQALDYGLISFTWYSVEAVSHSEEDVLFTLNFTGLKDGVKLSDMFEVQEFNVFPTEAYTNDAERRNIELGFSNAKETVAFELFQNQPNPFKDETNISFNLPTATTATLTISDATGRTLKVIEGDYDKGYNEISLDRNTLSASGVLYYQLETSEYSATKKMIIVE